MTLNTKIILPIIILILFNIFLFFFIILSTQGISIFINTDSESDLFQAVKMLNKYGGTISINTPVIHISSNSTIKLNGSKVGGIIGMKLSDGTYPRIDFSKARDAGSKARGFTISGSNQSIKNLIIEFSGDNGIYINGKNNTLDHIITRYNSDSGIQLSDEASDNTIQYCWSYRNCDVSTFGANADGFASKLNSHSAVFSYCFSWDNSDEGWGSYDKEGDNSANATYLHCACWNNGNPAVFTGKYDFDNSKELDKNMLSIQHIIKSDPNFESNYKNKNYNIDSAKIGDDSVQKWIDNAADSMNGNGFSFGSKYTKQDTSIVRTADYCVAFNHKKKGFNNNNSVNCLGKFSNCVSFGNDINYQLPYTFDKFENNYGWGARKNSFKTEAEIETPRNTAQIEAQIYSVRDKIIESVYANTFPDSINFDEIIDNLNSNNI